MSDSEDNNSIEETPAPPENKRGRPAGKADSSKRCRRTAQEISDDKIRIAQMRMDTLREMEEKKLANKKTRKPRAKVEIPEAERRTTVSSISPQKEAPRDDSPSPERFPSGGRRQQLYDSWFTSSPRARRY